MKLIFTLLLTLVSCAAFAQDPMYAGSEDAKPTGNELYLQKLPYNEATGKIEFQEVLGVEGKTKAEIHSLAKEWFAKTFVSANAVIQMDDKEAGKLIGRARLNGASILLQVESKDGRARYTLTDILYDSPVSTVSKKYPAEMILSDANVFKANGKPKAIPAEMKSELIRSNAGIVASLSETLNKSTDSDW